jgi:hypothetical protein
MLLLLLLLLLSEVLMLARLTGLHVHTLYFSLLLQLRLRLVWQARGREVVRGLRGEARRRGRQVLQPHLGRQLALQRVAVLVHIDLYELDALAALLRRRLRVQHARFSSMQQ